MIVRRWSGMVLKSQASEYLKLMREVAIPDYPRIDGNILALCLSNEREQVVEVTMLTIWKDMEAVRAFAGSSPHLAKYYDFDASYLLWKPLEVEHAEIDGASFGDDFIERLARCAR